MSSIKDIEQIAEAEDLDQDAFSMETEGEAEKPEFVIQDVIFSAPKEPSGRGLLARANEINFNIRDTAGIQEPEEDAVSELDDIMLPLDDEPVKDDDAPKKMPEERGSSKKSGVSKTGKKRGQAGSSARSAAKKDSGSYSGEKPAQERISAKNDSSSLTENKPKRKRISAKNSLLSLPWKEPVYNKDLLLLPWEKPAKKRRK